MLAGVSLNSWPWPPYVPSCCSAIWLHSLPPSVIRPCSWVILHLSFVLTPPKPAFSSSLWQPPCLRFALENWCSQRGISLSCHYMYCPTSLCTHSLLSSCYSRCVKVTIHLCTGSCPFIPIQGHHPSTHSGPCYQFTPSSNGSTPSATTYPLKRNSSHVSPLFSYHPFLTLLYKNFWNSKQFSVLSVSLSSPPMHLWIRLCPQFLHWNSPCQGHEWLPCC